MSENTSGTTPSDPCRRHQGAFRRFAVQPRSSLPRGCAGRSPSIYPTGGRLVALVVLLPQSVQFLGAGFHMICLSPPQIDLVFSPQSPPPQNPIATCRFPSLFQPGLAPCGSSLRGAWTSTERFFPSGGPPPFWRSGPRAPGRPIQAECGGGGGGHPRPDGSPPPHLGASCGIQGPWRGVASVAAGSWFSFASMPRGGGGRRVLIGLPARAEGPLLLRGYARAQTAPPPSSSFRRGPAGAVAWDGLSPPA